MTLIEFAERYKVKIKKDSCGDEIIPGRSRRGETQRVEDRSHVFTDLDGRDFEAYLTFPTKRHWTGAKKRLVAVGLALHRDGEADGIMAFDPENEAQVKLLFRLARICAKRQLTPEQLERLRARLADQALSKKEEK